MLDLRAESENRKKADSSICFYSYACCKKRKLFCATIATDASGIGIHSMTYTTTFEESVGGNKSVVLLSVPLFYYYVQDGEIDSC